MTDFTLQAIADELEGELRARRLLDLPVPWAHELVYPAYEDASLRNVPHTVAQLLGVPLPDSAPLRPQIWGEEVPVGEVGRVVVYLLDGVGYRYLMQMLAEDAELRQIVHDLTQGRGFVPTTSIAPSTTAVALPTLWTGVAPARTGLFGTVTYLREVWQLGNMLSYAPVVGQHAPNTFTAWGLTPNDIIQHAPSLGEHLAKHGIPTIMHADKKLWRTGLSEILHRGVAESQLHIGMGDFFPRLTDALRATRGQRCYVGVYDPNVDSVAHQYGALSHYTHHELKSRLRALRDVLADTSLHDGQTTFILTADHGHYDVDNALDMAYQVELRRGILPHLSMAGSGECRLPILHVRAGGADAVKATIDAHFSDVLTYVDSDVALQAGLFGDVGDLHPETPYRLGDIVLIARLGTIVEDTNLVRLKLVSWHGGLSDWEMLTPLLWTRF